MSKSRVKKTAIQGGFKYTYLPKPDHNNSYCAHDYKIDRVVMNHPKGGVIVFGDDKRFHVVHKDCVGTREREISDKY